MRMVVMEAVVNVNVETIGGAALHSRIESEVDHEEDHLRILLTSKHVIEEMRTRQRRFKSKP